jgi:hypothetical protein
VSLTPSMLQEIERARDAGALMLASVEGDWLNFAHILQLYGLSENLGAAELFKGCASFICYLLKSVLVEADGESLSGENIAEILRAALLDAAEVG